MSSQTLNFTTRGHAGSRGRYVIAENASVSIGDIANGERVGVGVIPGKDGSDALVHQHGPTQTAVPLYAVATAIAGGVIPADALVAAFEETGSLATLKAAIAEREKAVAAKK
jgi:hypothetical protein